MLEGTDQGGATVARGWRGIRGWKGACDQAGCNLPDKDKSRANFCNFGGSLRVVVSDITWLPNFGCEKSALPFRQKSLAAMVVGAAQTLVSP